MPAMAYIDTHNMNNQGNDVQGSKNVDNSGSGR